MSNAMATWTDENLFAQLKEGARILSKTALIPKQFQNRPEDCFLGLHIAQRLGCDPLLVLQNLNVIHGRPSWSAQFIIAQANASGVFKHPIAFEIEERENDVVEFKCDHGSKDKHDWRNHSMANIIVTAMAVTRSGASVQERVSLRMAVDAGWASRNPKYAHMPEVMLRYRAATFLVRFSAPEILMGMHTADEIIDAPEDVAAIEPSATAEQIAGKLASPPGLPARPDAIAKGARTTFDAVLTEADEQQPNAGAAEPELQTDDPDAALEADRKRLLERVESADSLETIEAIRRDNARLLTGAHKAAVTRAILGRTHALAKELPEDERAKLSALL